MRIWGLSLTAAAIVLVAACGGAASDTTSSTNTGTPTNPGGTAANPNTVSLIDSSFSPTSITVKVGSTVTWQWSTCSDTSSGYGYGGACITHQISFDDGSGAQSPLQDQGTFNRTFTAAGTFKYHCLVHGSQMSGQVVVQ
jgi:plastocyanin